MILIFKLALKKFLILFVTVIIFIGLNAGLHVFFRGFGNYISRVFHSAVEKKMDNESLEEVQEWLNQMEMTDKELRIMVYQDEYGGIAETRPVDIPNALKIG